MPLDQMYTYQDLRLRIIRLLTRTYVLGTYVYCILTRTYVLGSYVYCTYQGLCSWIICILYLPGPMSLDHMYTYQDLCPWIVCILTRTYVFGSYMYLPGPMSLDHMYTVLTRTYFLESYVYLHHMYTYQDFYALGSYVYLPGPTSLDHTYTYQDLCPWIICILTRTYVLRKTTDKQAQDRLIHKTKNDGENYCTDR